MHSSVGNGNRSLVYDGKIAGLYDLEETLGSGHFAVVKLARHVFTGEKVAVKVIDKTKLDEVSRAHLFQEVRCMKLVQHPNVVRLYEVIDTQTKLYLILELGDGGDLYDYIMKHEGGLSENLAREYFRQIVRAISYCHQLHVVHRDLKPENVVFFEKLGVVKLTDFGFSNKFCPGQKLETSCGSLAYSAPEILLGDSYDAPAVDIWSLGVILYMLVCGNPPFEKANDSETLTMIMDCKYTMPSHVSSGCRRLISMMLVREPEKRANLSQIASDSWLIQGAQQEIVPEYLPLVSRQQVSDEDHTLIINKMVTGNIATKEEILDALDRNEYNHITATYFLLAERKLRQQRQEQMQKRRPELSLPVSSSSRLSPRSRIQGLNRDPKISGDPNNHLLVPTSNQLCTPRTPGAETTGGRTRKCSIVQEEEDDEDEITGCTTRDELTTPLNRRGSRSEGRINIAIQDRVETERLKKEKDITTTTTTTGSNKSNLPSSTLLSSSTITSPPSSSSCTPPPPPKSSSKGIENICGIKLINKDTNNVRLRLGIAGGSSLASLSSSTSSPNRKQMHNIEKHFEKNLKLTGQQEDLSTAGVNDTEKRKLSLDYGTTSVCAPDIIAQTKILCDSSTIQIPITTIPQDTNIIPKYKTMPSPTRLSVILSGTRELNEIFEEGTDIGSSDTSTTTTPRPIVRNTHFTSRTSNTSTAVGSSRKTKFHKTRTPSCSSSDASDDDSESRKKRAHKIVDVTKPFQQQRRDSHDDSSDSQDHGPAPCGGGSGGGNTTTYLVYSTNNMTENDTQHNNSTSQNDSSTTTSSTQKSQNCEKTEQQTHYRRHRAGRRRGSETRLRESQSLNRITEVQETNELSSSIVTTATSVHTPSVTTIITTSYTKEITTDQQNENNNENCSNINNNNNNINEINTNCFESNNHNNNNRYVINGSVVNCMPSSPLSPLPITTPTVITKPKGFSARLFHGFMRRNDTHLTPSPGENDSKLTTASTTFNEDAIKQKRRSLNNECIDSNIMIADVDFSKSIHVTATCSPGTENININHHHSYQHHSHHHHHHHSTVTAKGSSATKKLKMLGRYFQVHKKLCIPLPGLFQKGKLYKTQSCGSLVRDKVSINSTTTTMSETITNNSSTSSSTSAATTKNNRLPSSDKLRNSAVLFTSEKGKILRSCLGGKFLGSSDGDINQNQNNIHYNNTKDIMTNSTSSSNNDSMQLSKSMINSCTTSSTSAGVATNSKSHHHKHNNSSNSCGGGVGSSIAATAAASLLQQFCSTIPASPPTPPDEDDNDLVEIYDKCSETRRRIKTLNLPDFSLQNEKDTDILNSSLHNPLNDVPLCSSKC